MKIKLFLYTFFVIVLTSCKDFDIYQDPISNDKTKPNPPKNIQVQNFKGGAYITYDLPDTENTLYVVADYVINEQTKVTRQTKTSYYSDVTKVEGFAESKDYTVTLRTVSRSNIMSDPVQVNVHPGVPPYLEVASGLTLSPTFGGVNAHTVNPDAAGVTLVYLYDDPIFGKYVIREQKYHDALEINYALRGFDTDPKKFGIYVTDKFGNKSQPLYSTVSPWYEVLLDKSKFSTYSLPSDNTLLGGWNLQHIWDGVIVGNNFWHTSETAKPYPHVGTFGLGQEARISRFILNQRNSWEGAYWANGTVEKFSLWGTNVPAPRDANLPVLAPVGTVVGEWVNMGNFDFPRPPSGNPISSPTAGDIQWWTDGVEFFMPTNSPPVRFLRIAVNKTWGNHTAAYICELTLFGGQL